METGHVDIEGNAVCLGDILECVTNPALHGLVVGADGRHFIVCGQEPETITYHIDAACNWRTIGNAEESPHLLALLPVTSQEYDPAKAGFGAAGADSRPPYRREEVTTDAAEDDMNLEAIESHDPEANSAAATANAKLGGFDCEAEAVMVWPLASSNGGTPSSPPRWSGSATMRGNDAREVTERGSVQFEGPLIEGARQRWIRGRVTIVNRSGRWVQFQGNGVVEDLHSRP